MPRPIKGEAKAQFIKRCIPSIIREGTAKDVNQAVAICNTIFDRKQRREKEKPRTE